MQRTFSFILAAFVMLMLPGSAEAQQSEQQAEKSSSVSNSAKPDFMFYGRLQTLGFLQVLKDDFRNNMRLYLYLKQARLGAKVTYDDIAFDLQLAFGGEEEVRAPSPGVALSLLDLSADIPVTNSLRVRVGQFKVPYSRENIVDEGFLLFSEPSIQNLGSRLGRDVGIAIHGYSGSFSSAIGVFTGGGRDVPIRYIPLDLGFPMVVARIGINDGLDQNLFTLKQTSYASNTGYAFFVNALYTKDSRVGHSTVLNVKLADKSLLLNSNWNPFVNKRPLEKSVLWQAGADLALRTSDGGSGLISGEAEFNYGSFKNGYGSIKLVGGRAQAAYFTEPFEVAVRYAFLRPDENFGATSPQGVIYKIVDSKLIQEIAAGISYYLASGRVKITAELPVFPDVPVVTEPNIGAYLLTQQPDQTTLIAPPTNALVGRQTVVEAHMQLQVFF